MSTTYSDLATARHSKQRKPERGGGGKSRAWDPMFIWKGEGKGVQISGETETRPTPFLFLCLAVRIVCGLFSGRETERSPFFPLLSKRQMADIIQPNRKEERNLKKPITRLSQDSQHRWPPPRRKRRRQSLFFPCRRRDRHFKRFPFRPPLALTLRLQGPASQERFPFLPII